MRTGRLSRTRPWTVQRLRLGAVLLVLLAVAVAAAGPGAGAEWSWVVAALWTLAATGWWLVVPHVPPLHPAAPDRVHRRRLVRCLAVVVAGLVLFLGAMPLLAL